jgi:hypothetical protein
MCCGVGCEERVGVVGWSGCVMVGSGVQLAATCVLGCTALEKEKPVSRWMQRRESVKRSMMYLLSSLVSISVVLSLTLSPSFVFIV